jgi:hypothetical protein
MPAACSRWDEFDAIGGHHSADNDVGEMRPIEATEVWLLRLRGEGQFVNAFSEILDSLDAC